MSQPSFSLKKIAVPAFGPSLLYGVSNGATLPVIALTARELGASLAVSGLIAALIGVGSLMSNIPAALLISRIGERFSIIAAAILSMCAFMLAIVAPTIWVLGIAMLIVGMASSIFVLARQTYLTEAVPIQMRARALSTLGGTTRIGAFIGPFAGAALIHTMGLAGGFWVAIAAMVGAGAIALFGPELEAMSRHEGKSIPRVRIIDIARTHSRVFLTLGVGVMLVSALRASRQVVIPLWAEQLGLEPALTSVIYGLVAAIDMAVFYPAGKVMDERGRVWVAIPCTLLMGLSLMSMPLTGGLISFTLVALILGFGNGIGSGIVMTLGADSAPPGQRPSFLGLWRLMADIGSCGGPVLLAGVTAVASLSAAVVASGLLGCVAAAVFWKWLPRKLPA